MNTLSYRIIHQGKYFTFQWGTPYSDVMTVIRNRMSLDSFTPTKDTYLVMIDKPFILDIVDYVNGLGYDYEDNILFKYDVIPQLIGLFNITMNVINELSRKSGWNYDLIFSILEETEMSLSELKLRYKDIIVFNSFPIFDDDVLFEVYKTMMSNLLGDNVLLQRLVANLSKKKVCTHIHEDYMENNGYYFTLVNYIERAESPLL